MNAQTKKPNLAIILYWTATALVALGVGYGIATKTALTVAILSGILTILIVRKKMLWGIMAVLFLPVIGELYRLPFGPDNGTLISDVAIGAIVLVWLFEKFLDRHHHKKTSQSESKSPLSSSFFLPSSLTKPLAIFSAIAIFSLLISLSFLTFKEVATGSLYLARLIGYVMLGVITMDTVRTPKSAQKLLTAMIISALLIAIAGFIQLIVYPDLGKLEEYGWDPHQTAWSRPGSTPTSSPDF